MWKTLIDCFLPGDLGEVTGDTKVSRGMFGVLTESKSKLVLFPGVETDDAFSSDLRLFIRLLGVLMYASGVGVVTLGDFDGEAGVFTGEDAFAGVFLAADFGVLAGVFFATDFGVFAGVFLTADFGVLTGVFFATDFGVFAGVFLTADFGVLTGADFAGVLAGVFAGVLVAASAISSVEDFGVLAGVFLAADFGVLAGVFLAADLGVLAGVFLAADLGVLAGVLLAADFGVLAGVFLTADLGVFAGVFLAADFGVLGAAAFAGVFFGDKAFFTGDGEVTTILGVAGSDALVFLAGVFIMAAKPSKSALSLALSLAVSLTGLLRPFLVSGVLATVALLVTMMSAGDSAW